MADAPRRREEDRRRQTIRIAAVGDFHCGEADVGAYRSAFARVNDEADVLLLVGDLTNWGTQEEMRVTVGELAEVEIPIVAVLGNHDHESDQVADVCAILRERGVHLLDGDSWELDAEVGFAGTKGFMGGFGRGSLTAFGERETKVMVEATLDEVRKLELALRKLATPIRVVLLHYAPVVDTVQGEPEIILPFLGSDRLAEPLDRYGVSVAFHGHAHHGAFRGATPGGVPVFNVSHALLKREGVGEMFYVYEIPRPGWDGGEN
ncbi:MAG: metallophosphoesterase [Gemmatimonadota bacterium]|jgi:Icc-related predicted phosphoesterase|nr:metallophosphoesterase [Gemmatimonadota bacterium]